VSSVATEARAGGFTRASLAEFKPLPEGGDQYPLEYIETNFVIKLRESDDAVTVGICDPSDQQLIDDLRKFHAKQVRFHEIDRNELAGFLGEKLSGAVAKPAGEGGAAAGGADEKLSLDKLANDAPIINLVNSVLIEGIRRGASDIHIEGYADEGVIRYRLDGVLHTVNRIGKDRFPAVATRLKIMSNLNIMERRLPQDGRITVHLGEDSVDMRLSVVPISDGESFVLRLFNAKRTPLTLEQLGLRRDDLVTFDRMANVPNGLILVTGPTGSGKSTTLNAMLQRINSEEDKIITIEDPIEYQVRGVSQIQINERIGLTFDAVLRRVLRQDPDIIMVGEIRDNATAELAVRAALTGHLVLSTLHTQDTVSVISRLKNMAVEPYMIAAVLRGAVAQRLVRRLCPECRRKTPFTPAQKELLARHKVAGDSHMQSVGCKACNGTGYRGRVGMFELLTADTEIEEMILSGRREPEIRAYLETKHMRPLVVDGLEKVVQGLTTLTEVERAVVA
jgi:general secretion pathway protein E